MSRGGRKFRELCVQESRWHYRFTRSFKSEWNTKVTADSIFHRKSNLSSSISFRFRKIYDNHHYYYNFNPCQAFSGFSDCINVHVSLSWTLKSVTCPKSIRSVSEQAMMLAFRLILPIKELKRCGSIASMARIYTTQGLEAGSYQIGSYIMVD